MHGNLPPLEITGPNEPHAQDGLPMLNCPSFADHKCSVCLGYGAWNELFYCDSFRTRLKICPTCNGFGWVTRDGHDVAYEIQFIDGHPTWVLKDFPLSISMEPPCEQC